MAVFYVKRNRQSKLQMIKVKHMKHSIKPYSKDISEVQWAFYKSTKDYLIPVWCIKEKWKLNAKDAPRLHISHERNESENIPILVEEIGDAFQGIPKLRCLSLLEYLLGVPWASPSLSPCLSSFFSHRTLLDHQTLHPHKTSTENSVRSVSIIKQITTLSTVANQLIFYFCIMSTVI